MRILKFFFKEIREIKQRLTILQVLQYYNLKLVKNIMLKCQFHTDDTVSMKIYSQSNTFNFFGCDKNGDLIEFCPLNEASKKSYLKQRNYVAKYSQ